nr:Aminotransferase class-V [uncultured bacterium]
MEKNLMTHRVFNFNAGPSALPLPVLEQVQKELLDFGGTGMSVMEMSHRSEAFEKILDRADKGLRRLMNIPDDYAVLFLGGGASLQFSMVPMNLYLKGKPVDLIHTGVWTKKAMDELKESGRDESGCDR